MLSRLGPTEIIIIVLALVIIFGSSKINDLARSLGETQKELKKTKKEYENSLNETEADDTNQEVDKT